MWILQMNNDNSLVTYMQSVAKKIEALHSLKCAIDA